MTLSHGRIRVKWRRDFFQTDCLVFFIEFVYFELYTWIEKKFQTFVKLFLENRLIALFNDLET